MVRSLLFSAVLLLAGSISPASADPILVTANIHGHALVDIDGLPVVVDRFEQVGAALGSFDADGSAAASIGQDSATAAASQHTTVTTARWFGSGSSAASATGDLGLDVGESISVLGIRFSIAEPTPYRFRGTIGAAGESNSEVALSGGPSSLWADGLGLSVEDELPNFRTTLVTHSGVLQPGTYFFFADAQSAAGLADRTTPGRGTFDFDFQLGGSPTPEPASGILFGTALLTAACRRRRSYTENRPLSRERTR